jgi:hypothetical protein
MLNVRGVKDVRAHKKIAGRNKIRDFNFGLT